MQTIDVTYHGMAMSVTGNYTKGQPGHWYARNGDPGDPPEPADFYIEKIMVGEQDITDFFDGLEHALYVDGVCSAQDCYVEIEDLCIDIIEGGGYEKEGDSLES
jgi:hypothetical protein